MKNLVEYNRITTGSLTVDLLLGFEVRANEWQIGLHRDHDLELSAERECGKTLLGLHLLQNAQLNGLGVIWVSDQPADLLLASQLNVNVPFVRLQKDEAWWRYPRISQGLEKRKIQLVVVDGGGTAAVQTPELGQVCIVALGREQRLRPRANRPLNSVNLRSVREWNSHEGEPLRAVSITHRLLEGAQRTEGRSEEIVMRFGRSPDAAEELFSLSKKLGVVFQLEDGEGDDVLEVGDDEDSVVERIRADPTLFDHLFSEVVHRMYRLGNS